MKTTLVAAIAALAFTASASAGPPKRVPLPLLHGEFKASPAIIAWFKHRTTQSAAVTPAYVTEVDLEAMFEEEGATFAGKRRPILDVSCVGRGYSRGAFPYERYHIFECYLTTKQFTDGRYRITTTYGKNRVILYNGTALG